MKIQQPIVYLFLILWPYGLQAHSISYSPSYSIDTSEQVIVCKPFLHVVLPYVGEVDRDGDGASDLIGASIPATELLEAPILDSFDGASLQYSINIRGEAIHQQADSLILSCKDYASYAGEFFVEVHAWSQSTIVGTCSSLILGTDGHGTCEIDPLFIGVSVNTSMHRPVSDVHVTFEGDIDTMLQTNTDGSASLHEYQWTALNISPRLNTTPLDGVTVTDIVLIRRHIIGIEALSSPYQLIAADINKDGRVSTRDIVELQRMLVGQQVGFRSNTSWRFVCVDWKFQENSDPWEQGPIPESKILDLFARSTYVEFIAVKIGDVTGEAPL
ncbi:MAG: hypothetical protein KTR30_24600 [Saprospiraceae bacterium]|nr:hypothetical protein [Saprospiraceae bacterium]